MKQSPHLLAVSIAAIAVSATFATAWAQKPAGATGGAPAPAASGAPSAKASASASASARAPGAPASATPGAASSASPSASASASASATPSAGGPPTGTVEELFRRGNEFAKVDRWADAEPFYRAAWEQKKSYDIAGNLGLAEFQQNKWRDAAEHLSFAVKYFPASGKSANRELLDNVFAKVKAEVGAVDLIVNVPGAEVIVDGKKVGISPLGDTLFVDPGSRTIEVSLSGYEPAKETVLARKGDSKKLTITLTPKKDQVAVTAPPGYRPQRALIVVGGAVAAIGIGAGVAFTVLANGQATEAEEQQGKLSGTSACFQTGGAALPSACADLRGHLENQGTYSNAALVSFIAGGAFALGTAGLAVWRLTSAPRTERDRTPAASAKASARVVPVVDASTRGVAIVGRW